MDPEIAQYPVAAGEIVAAKYRVGDVIGVGGMGVVFEADQFHLGRKVAIKLLLAHSVAVPEVVGRFLREARIVARLESEHVVRVLDAGTLPTGVPYIAMERLRGQDLAALLESRGPLPIDDVVLFVAHARRGLEEAHRQGLVHRDLKPQNLFLTERSDGSRLVKILDFGVSKLQADVQERALDGVSTSNLTILGSPPYMSPEQHVSAKGVDARSDVWALGVILFELLAGERPFVGSTLPALSLAVAHGATPSLRARRADVPAWLESVVARCLAKSPADRYPDVSGLLADLTQARVSTNGGGVVVAPSPEPARRTSRVAALAVAAATVLAAATLAAWGRRGAPEAASPATSVAVASSAIVASSAPPVTSSLPPPSPSAAPVVAVPAPSSLASSSPAIAAPRAAPARRPEPRRPGATARADGGARAVAADDPFAGVLERN